MSTQELLKLLDWIPYLGGAGFMLVALAILLVPGFIPVMTQWLTAMTPAVKGLAEGVVKFVQVMWEGLQDVVDNASTVMFVGVVIIIAMWYGQHMNTSLPIGKECTSLEDVRPDYKLVPRTPAEKREYLRRNPDAAKPESSWWSNLF